MKANTANPATPGKAGRTLVRWNSRDLTFRVRQTKTSVWRIAVQAGFLASSILLGWQFARFVHAAQATASSPLPYRPPGVEGYLPISGLMGIVDWVYQGRLNLIHPAATVLLLIFILLAYLLRKSFCGWICPVGFISENLARLGQLLFKRNFRLPKGLDVGLRSLKYILLAFFVAAIFTMTPRALHDFIESPYNKVSDAKMLLFFAHLSPIAIWVLAGLAVASILVHSFWCRYLCPYGALVGLFSWMSPVKVRRDTTTCTECGICDKICPARLPVMSKLQITSVECIGCEDCVTSCPVPTALEIGTKKRALSARQMALIIVSVFLLGYIAARIGGVWHSQLSDDEIRRHISQMNSEEYSHPKI